VICDLERGVNGSSWWCMRSMLVGSIRIFVRSCIIVNPARSSKDLVQCLTAVVRWPVNTHSFIH